MIGGAIVMTPATDVGHQRVSRRLQSVLESAWPANEVFDAPIDLDLPRGQRVQPDLVVVERGRTGKRLALPVALVVEIVSPGSAVNDRVTQARRVRRRWHLRLLGPRPARRRGRLLCPRRRHLPPRHRGTGRRHHTASVGPDRHRHPHRSGLIADPVRRSPPRAERATGSPSGTAGGDLSSVLPRSRGNLPLPAGQVRRPTPSGDHDCRKW